MISCFLTSPQALAREKGGTTKDKETRKIDIDLRFNQRYTTDAPASNPNSAYSTPKLVNPAIQPQPAAAAPTDTDTQEAPTTASSTPAPAPEPDPAPTPDPTPAPAPAPAVTQTLSFLGSAIPYQNGGMANGQAIIDANPNGTSSTWGGATPYSGTDGLNTHFIGHHWGAFDSVLSLGNGGVVTVYDSNGQAYNYTIYKISVVDVNGNDTTTGASLYGEITSLGGGERIVLQTCIDDTTRRIVFAS
jgi:hypothetical protein